MRVKRFVATTMQEAIDQVKTDFGLGAVILHTKRVRSRGIWGIFRRSRVEVVAAAEKPTATTQPHHNQRVQEPALTDRPSISLRTYLTHQDIGGEFIDELLSTAGKVSGDALTDTGAHNADLKERVRHNLAASIRCANPDDGLGPAKIHYLVGPTGVGKTTTIAKLAANYALLANRRVALLTNDTYRIAAVEQLKVYAGIIGVPLEVVMTPDELKEVAHRYLDSDMILVDTAGRNHNHHLQMSELKDLVTATPDSSVHLVLSASTRWHDLVDILQHFNALPLSSLIITKIDETSTYGMLYNVCRMSGHPLSFLTNGQSVPDDIEIATTHRVVDLILGDVRGYT